MEVWVWGEQRSQKAGDSSLQRVHATPGGGEGESDNTGCCGQQHQLPCAGSEGGRGGRGSERPKFRAPSSPWPSDLGIALKPSVSLGPYESGLGKGFPTETDRVSGCPTAGKLPPVCAPLMVRQSR